MHLIELRNINKVYKINESESLKALKDISISFDHVGLVSIYGKSGSGKSTLLNLIGLFDEPTTGEYKFNKVDVKNLKKSKNKFLNENIGVIFQQYLLLEDQTVLFNVMIPALINGKPYKESKNNAIKLLSEFGIENTLHNKRVEDLSGGEKQRVALARSMINNPQVLLCDEPTGSLDELNSVVVFEYLKKLSKTMLVIIVSHNIDLIKKYSDRIIEISDGRVINDTGYTVNENYKKAISKGKKSNNIWVGKLSLSNIKRRLTRNIISFCSIFVCIISTMLILGFISNVNNSINNESLKHYDYGSALISNEKVYSGEEDKIKLIQQERPDYKETIKNKGSDYKIALNYDYFVPANMNINLGEEIIEGITFAPIYSYCGSYNNDSLLIKGKLPRYDSLFNVVINKSCYDLLKDKIKSEVLNQKLNIHNEVKYNYYSFDYNNTIIEDIFILDRTISINAVVDELNFLSIPTIYYSYLALDEFMNDSLLNNLSSYLGYDITWANLINVANNLDVITSYSYRLFLNDINKAETLEKDCENKEGVVISSKAIEIKTALSLLMEGAVYGTQFFLIIAIIGSILIIGIISYAAYTEDHKRSAILFCLGAKRNDIYNLYLSENIFVVIAALLFSLIIYWPISLLVNLSLKKLTSFDSLISFPNNIILDIPYSSYLLLIVLTLGITLISTVFPIYLSRKKSLIEEVQAE